MSAPRDTYGHAVLMSISSIVLFTIMDAVAKGLTQHYPALQVVWARYTGAMILTLLILAPRVPKLMKTDYLPLHFVRSGFQIGATLCFFAALGYIGLAEATAIGDLNPVMITLGAAVFLGEKLGPRRLFGVLAALVGALIIIRPGMGVFSWAALLPLGTAICYSGYALTTRVIGPRESVWTSMIYTGLIGCAITTLLMIWNWTPVAPQHLLAFCGIGLIGALAQLCMIRAFTMAEASSIAPFSYVGIITAALWGYLFFNELPDLWTGVGALVIVLAGLYVWHRETRAAREAKVNVGSS